jgi:hypothetical protein
MSVALTSTLQKYAILSTNIDGGTVNIQNGNYSALNYDAIITSTGTPNGENTTDRAVALNNLTTLTQSLIINLSQIR